MTRQQLIDKGKVWHVYSEDNADNILFEGTKTKCLEYIRMNYGMRVYKKGKTVRLAQIIYEPLPEWMQKAIDDICELIPDCTLEDDRTIRDHILFHEFDLSAAAERIAKEFDLDYKVVYNLIS